MQRPNPFRNHSEDTADHWFPVYLDHFLLCSQYRTIRSFYIQPHHDFGCIYSYILVHSSIGMFLGRLSSRYLQ